MSKTTRLAFGALILGGALSVAVPFAGAVTLTDGQISAIVGLLQSFGASASTIANVEAALKGIPTPANSSASSAPSASACLDLTANLFPGTSGSSVSALQNFLVAQGDLASGSATGYFGPLTTAAIQKWQSAHGIVSSGTSFTTGYGAAGPATRASFACGGSGSGTSSGTGSASSGVSTNTSSNAPSTVNVSSTDSSDATLDSELSGINAQLNGLDSDSANADGDLNSTDDSE